MVRSRLPLVAVALLAVSGCALHRQQTMADRFVHQGEPSIRLGNPQPGTAAPEDSLQAFIEKVRALQANARPRPTDAATSIEAMTPALADALAREAATPGADASIAAGDQYSRLGVLDAAMEHYSRAIKDDSTRADAYDRMARIWRDWGFPNLALGDAYRAAFYAPRSAVVQNTLGTILQKLGQTAAARAAYERALTFDSQAAYAWNNICSAYLAERRPHEALASCRRAVELNPALRTAQANLAEALRVDPGTSNH